MKKLIYLLMIFICGFACTCYAEEWYEREEASGYDYIGSVATRVASESEGTKYTPEYTKNEIKNAIAETDTRQIACSSAVARDIPPIPAQPDSMPVVGMGWGVDDAGPAPLGCMVGD